MQQFGKLLEQLPDIMSKNQVDEDIIGHHYHAIKNHSNQLLTL